MTDTIVATPAKSTTPAKKARVSKPKGEKKVSSHPSYNDMVIAAIKALAERGGSSRQAISKYVQANYKVGSDANQVNTQIKLALKRAVVAQKLKNSKGKGASGSFKITESGKSALKQKEKKKVKKTVKKAIKKSSPKKKSATGAKKEKKVKPSGAAKIKKPAVKKASASPSKAPKTPKPAGAKPAKTPTKKVKAAKPAKAPKAAKTPTKKVSKPKSSPKKKVVKKTPKKAAAVKA